MKSVGETTVTDSRSIGTGRIRVAVDEAPCAEAGADPRQTQPPWKGWQAVSLLKSECKETEGAAANAPAALSSPAGCAASTGSQLEQQPQPIPHAWPRAELPHAQAERDPPALTRTIAKQADASILTRAILATVVLPG